MVGIENSKGNIGLLRKQSVPMNNGCCAVHVKASICPIVQPAGTSVPEQTALPCWSSIHAGQHPSHWVSRIRRCIVPHRMWLVAIRFRQILSLRPFWYVYVSCPSEVILPSSASVWSQPSQHSEQPCTMVRTVEFRWSAHLDCPKGINRTTNIHPEQIKLL